MKLLKKAAAVLLAAVLALSGYAFAEEEPLEYTIPEEMLNRIYDPANYEKDFEPGIINVELKTSVTRYSDYGELFPELDLEYIVPLSRSYYGNENRFYFQTVKVVLNRKTREDTIDAVEKLKVNENVVVARLRYYPYGIWPQSDLAGDMNGDGSVTNADLVTLARALVGLVELTDRQLKAADLDGDGQASNSDIVMLARQLVSSVPDPLRTINQLNSEAEQAALNAYTAAYGMGVYSMRYLGEFVGASQVFLITHNGVAPAVIVDIEVAGNKFTFSSPLTHIFVCRDGQILRLEDAYDTGWLTDNDVETIHGLYTAN